MEKCRSGATDQRTPFDNPERRRLHVAVHIHMQMNIKYAYVRSYIRTADCTKPTARSRVPSPRVTGIFSPLIKKAKVYHGKCKRSL